MKKRSCWNMKSVVLLSLISFSSSVLVNNIVQALPTSQQNEASLSSLSRSQISAPLDLLSESLASSTSLISHLMKQNEDRKGGPVASALLASKQSRSRISPNPRFKMRRRQPTTSPNSSGTPIDRKDIGFSGGTREPLVITCDDPEGCATPISGAKYNPNEFGGPSTERDVLKTIFRQEVPKRTNNSNKKKKPIMRIRKKQRKPLSPKDDGDKKKIENEELTVEAVQMVTAMIKEAGPTLSSKEIEIIADVSQEVGAEVNEEQVKVISMLAKGMGPSLDSNELETIATVASAVEEDSNLASEAALEVMVEMAKSKVGRPLDFNDVERLKSIMMTDREPVTEGNRNTRPRGPKSGINDHGAEMLSQMMTNLGSDISPTEVQIVSDMIKELDKDISKETADVMAEVLKQVDGDVTPEVVHNVSAIVSQDEEPTLELNDIAVIASMMDMKPLSEDISPDVIEMMIEIIVEDEEQKSDQDIVTEVKIKTGEDIEPSDVEMVEHIAQAIGENKALNLVESDLELISLISDSKSEKKEAKKGGFPVKNQDHTPDISQKEAEFLSEVVNIFGTHVAPAEEAELKTEVKKALPDLNDNQAEVMTQVLVQMGPEIEPETIVEVANTIESSSLDVRADNVEEIAEMVNKIDVILEPQEVETLAEMVKKVGPNMSHRQMKMIARMGKQSGMDINMKEVAVINQIVNELGPIISESEVKLISLMTGSKEEVNESEEEITEELVEEVKEILEDMGSTVNEMEKKAIVEVVKVEEMKMSANPKEAEAKAEVIAEVIKEAGPESMTVENIEMIVESANHADNINTPEEVGNVTKLLEKVEGITFKAEEVVAVSEVIDGMKHFGSGSEMRPSEVVQAARTAQSLGLNVSPRKVKVIEEIKDVIQDSRIPAPITSGDAKLIEAISEVMAKTQETREDNLNLIESEHVAEMIEKVGDHVSPREMNAVKQILKEMLPELPNEKVETLTQVLVEVGPKVDLETVNEVSKVIAENEVDVSDNEVKEVAEMTRKLSTELSIEQVEVISDVKKNSKRPSSMSLREINQAVVLANRIENNKDKKASSSQALVKVDENDVQIVSEIIDMLDAVDNPDELELIAVMTKTASQDILSTENSEKIRFNAGDSNDIDENGNDDVMDDNDAEEIADLITDLGGDHMSSEAEEAVVVEVMKMSDDISKEDADTAVKLIMKIDDVSKETVQEVVEIVKDPEVDIKAQSVDKVVEMAKELPEDISSVDVMVVANLATRMGPAITQREMMMIARLAKSSNVDVGFKEVAMITEILKEMGPETSAKEAELVEKIVKEAKKEVIDPHAAEEISKLANEIGEFMSSEELKKMKVALKTMAPKLNEDEAAVMTEIINQVGPDVAPEVVEDIAAIAKETSEEVTPHLVDMIADMTAKLDAKGLDSEEMETAVDLLENVNDGAGAGSRLSHREMQMVKKQMAENTNIKLTTKDVQIINDIVNMIGPDVTEKEAELITVLANKGNVPDTKSADNDAENLKDSLDKMIDQPVVELEEIQKVEEMISKMEPLMTSSKVQVMSQILIEADPDKVKTEDLRELADIIMEASDDITPGEIEAIADVARDTDNELEKTEIKVVAEMSAKLGESLSNREVNMIGRMMRSSGLSLTANDIKSVADMVKIRSGKQKELSDGDAALLSKMTELIAETKPTMKIPKRFETLAEPTVSSLPRKPVVSALPETNRNRLKVNLEMKNRYRGRLPAAPTMAAPPPRAVAPVTRYNYKILSSFEDEKPTPMTSFGMKQEEENKGGNADLTPLAPTQAGFPNFPKEIPEKNSIRELMRRPVRPTSTSEGFPPITTTTASEFEESTRIRLEEFLMRNRPGTPLRSFPSKSTLPDEENRPLAVEPTSPDEVEQDLDDEPPPVGQINMPGNSFMQINMGGTSFSSDFPPSDADILREPENLNEDVDTFQALFVPPGKKNEEIKLVEPPTEEVPIKVEPTVSKDTLKSVAENFAFAKDKPQSMLMNFLTKKEKPRLPPMPTESPRSPIIPIMSAATTQAPPSMIKPQPPFMMSNTSQRPRFNLETSTKLDKSIAGNFINMKMGPKTPAGVPSTVISKLEEDKISLSPDGNNFMSIRMNLNPDFLMERMSTLEKSFDNLPELKRPLRKINVKEFPWRSQQNTKEKPTIRRPSWPQKKQNKIPSTKKPVASRVWVEEVAKSQTPFTVRPTKTPTPFNYNSNSPYGAMVEKQSYSYVNHDGNHDPIRVNHDVKLKSPFESSVKGFHGNQGYTRPKPKKFTTKTNLVTPPSTFPDYEIYDEDDDDNQNNYQILQDGYKGIGSLSHPGLHDDRPPFVKFNHQNSPKHNIAEASFGGLKFNLPTSGKLPDRPMREEKDDTSSMLRDLPNLDLDLHTSAGSNKKESHNYAKSYLRNPFGADFIRLEVDADRFKHNKTRRIGGITTGGIHHVPLKINGYAETSEFPVSSDKKSSERPLIRHRPRPMRHGTRPKKHTSSSSSSTSADPELVKRPRPHLKHAMHEAMEKFPNAVKKLPNIMQSLVSEHASWIDKVWSSAINSGDSSSTGKSFDNVDMAVSSSDLSEKLVKINEHKTSSKTSSEGQQKTT